MRSGLAATGSGESPGIGRAIYWLATLLAAASASDTADANLSANGGWTADR